MLDKNDTAKKLKVALAEAFGKWNAIDRRAHTKAELSRQCADKAGRPCSPQDVSSWFSTGRMDKAWLPVLEEILGAPLGFSHSSTPSADLLTALELVMQTLRSANEITTSSVIPLFTLASNGIQETGQIAQQAALLLSRSAPTQETNHDPDSKVSGRDFDVNTDEVRDGPGAEARDEQEGGREPGGSSGRVARKRETR